MRGSNYQNMEVGDSVRTVVKVPGGLLSDRRLSGSAKLLWVWLRLDGQASGSLRSLEQRYGLSRNAIKHGLEQLSTSGWLNEPGSGQADAEIPVDLLRDQRVGTSAKLLYGVLQLTGGGTQRDRRFRHADLPWAPSVVKPALKRLQETGWVELTQRNKFSPVYFKLRNPRAEQRERERLAAELRLTEAAYRGETLMREYLSLIVDSDEYDDNASPGFLVNPYTEEELQFDRYYPPRVAFEFNGPQHYGPTERYPSHMRAGKQQGRDLIKHGICAKRGITLVVVRPEDLSLRAMQGKVGALLPQRSVDEHMPLLDLLEAASSQYRRIAAKWR